MRKIILLFFSLVDIFMQINCDIIQGNKSIYEGVLFIS